MRSMSLSQEKDRIAFLLLFICLIVRFMMMVMKMMRTVDSKENDYERRCDDKMTEFRVTTIIIVDANRIYRDMNMFRDHHEMSCCYEISKKLIPLFTPFAFHDSIPFLSPFILQL